MLTTMASLGHSFEKAFGLEGSADLALFMQNLKSDMFAPFSPFDLTASIQHAQ